MNDAKPGRMLAATFIAYGTPMIQPLNSTTYKQHDLLIKQSLEVQPLVKRRFPHERCGFQFA